MSPIMALFQPLVNMYLLIVAFWGTCLAILQGVISALRAVREEAGQILDILEFLDGCNPIVRGFTTHHDRMGWQMLTIFKASSCILLLRLPRGRILHLEVDEHFITARLEVIKLEPLRRVPHLLPCPIGVHDTRVIKWTAPILPYTFESNEHHLETRPAIGSALRCSSNTKNEGERACRRKCIQVLTESMKRRKLEQDQVQHINMLLESDVRGAPSQVYGVPVDVRRLRKVLVKSLGASTMKRRALVNATNMFPDAGPAADATPKQVRLERQMHAALTENLSIHNLARAASLRKSLQAVGHLHRSAAAESIKVKARRKQRQYDLYAQGVPTSFSLLANLNNMTEEGH